MDDASSFMKMALTLMLVICTITIMLSAYSHLSMRLTEQAFELKDSIANIEEEANKESVSDDVNDNDASGDKVLEHSTAEWKSTWKEFVSILVTIFHVVAGIASLVLGSLCFRSFILWLISIKEAIEYVDNGIVPASFEKKVYTLSRKAKVYLGWTFILLPLIFI